MASFLLFPVTRNKITVGFLDRYRLPIVSIQGVPVHSNLAQSIIYKTYKLRLLRYWADRNLTHKADWKVIDLTSFKQAQDTTTAHMAQFIIKCISYTLPTMIILKQQGHATTNFCPRCGLASEKIQHMYQCTHKRSRGIWTASLDTLRVWIKARNKDPYIAIILADKLLYIAGERNDLPQCSHLTQHSDILRIEWPFINFGFIPISLTRT